MEALPMTDETRLEGKVATVCGGGQEVGDDQPEKG
jgi:hypothetical protein